MNYQLILLDKTTNLSDEPLKADTEYDKFKERTRNSLSAVEIHFIENFEKERKKLKK